MSSTRHFILYVTGDLAVTPAAAVAITSKADPGVIPILPAPASAVTSGADPQLKFLEFGDLIGEFFMAGTDMIVVPGPAIGEFFLGGLVDPELVPISVELFLMGFDQLKVPVATSRLVRTKRGPITWETP